MCKRCSIIEKTDKSGLCKVCSYKHRNIDKINKLIAGGLWTEKEINLVLEGVLYQKCSVVNEFESVLDGKTLPDIVSLVVKLHIGGRTPVKVRLECHSCGKSLIRPIGHYYRDRIYCGLKCRDLYKSECMSGKNSNFYKRVTTNCANCGKAMEVKPYKLDHCNQDGKNNCFCNRNCYNQYRSKYYREAKHPMYNHEYTYDQIERFRENTIKSLSSGKIPQTMTIPHLTIEEVLTKMKIEFIREYNCKYYSIDIFLHKHNLMIEIMGDYWHASPLKYNYENLSDIQMKDVRRDKSKNTYIRKYYNTEILYLWEMDIKQRLEVCEMLIDEYVENRGEISNYQSFNYHIQGGKLKLNDNLISPFFITQNP